MNKKSLIFSLVALLLFISVVMLRHGLLKDVTSERHHTIESHSAIDVAHEGESTYGNHGEKNFTGDILISLIPKSTPSDPSEIISLPKPEYTWYTQPTSKGAIKNSMGEIIFQATDELPFVSVRSRIDIPQILVVSGNRNVFLIDPQTKEKTVLPKQPSINKAKGFETWEWIDNRTLVAEYHVPVEGVEGNPVSCCQGHSTSETKLYTYSLPSRILSEVVLPDNLKGTPFNLGRVGRDGSIEILSSTNHLSDGEQIGWFNLSAHQFK